MDLKHRKHIKDNINRLVQLTNYDQLMDLCVKRKLLSGQMRKNIENDVSLNDKTDLERKEEKHKNLFLKLTKRGPTAYKELKCILIDLQMGEAAMILIDPDESNMVSIKNRKLHTQLSNPVERSPSYVENRKRKNLIPEERRETEPPNIGEDKKDSAGNESKAAPFHVIKSKVLKKDSEEIYPMVTKNRGILFMVNNIDFDHSDKRNGAEKDSEALKCLFKQLNFKIHSYTNMKKTDFVRILENVLKSNEASDCECFVLALMSHGYLENSKEVVLFSDNSNLSIHNIKDLFTDTKCSNLRNKPKVFLFPFCRGDDINILYRNKSDLETESWGRLPVSSGLRDVLICFAASHGFKAHRNPNSGNWYIQNFCKYMSQHAHDTDLESIIKKVQSTVGNESTQEGASQTANFENICFNKMLYFNPGIYEDENFKLMHFSDEPELI